MKNEVSSLELKHLVAELALTSCWIDKIYQPDAKTFLFAIRKPGEEKKFLRIELPKYLYLTNNPQKVVLGSAGGISGREKGCGFRVCIGFGVRIR